MIGDLADALTREWLCTNGLGGYASSTLVGCNTRRYHGLLIAALNPPVGRTLLLSKLDETLWVGGLPFELGTNEYHDGTIQPAGHLYVARFSQELGIPTIRYGFQGWQLEKKVWMERGENTTFIRYQLLAAPAACRLELNPLCAYRDFHSEQRGNDAWRFGTAEDGQLGWRIEAYDGARPYWLACDQPAGFEPAPVWYWQFLHRQERERGLDCLEDLFRPGVFSVALLPIAPVVFRVTAEPQPAPFHQALERAESYAQQVTEARSPATAGGPPNGSEPKPAGDPVLAKLRLAADQFIVRRGDAGGHSVVAGYHWFADWGRDTMIALPGLTLHTGRLPIAREILTTFAELVDRGMLPNTFLEQGTALYNTVDAGLWFFYAVDRYLQVSQDRTLLDELFPVLRGVVDWYLKGTRFNIKVDASDGLIYAGQPGAQLTWMDAKVDDWVVTPRIGKPVEANALWFNALCLMALWARELQQEAGDYQALAEQVGKSFRERYWYPAGRYLYDVLDGPEGNDTSLRPNQLLAISLPFTPIFGEQASMVLDTVTETLLTSYGLRSLAKEDPRYVGRCSGDRWLRDGAYHQGTVWPWLMGPFVDAYLRLRKDKARAREFLRPLIEHMDREAGAGTISEIFDGDEPHTARGCIAQAWSVAEVLRCWSVVSNA